MEPSEVLNTNEFRLFKETIAEGRRRGYTTEEIATLGKGGPIVGKRPVRSGAVLDALFRKPPSAGYQLGTDAMNATVAIWDNQLLRMLTAPMRRNRVTNLQERIAGQVDYERIPAGAVGQVVLRYLSTEAKFRRARAQDDLMRWKLMSIPAEQFARMTQARASARIIRDAIKDSDLTRWKRLPSRAKAIIDEAIFIEHLPVDNPVEVLRAALNREIDNMTEDIAQVALRTDLTDVEKTSMTRQITQGQKHHRAELALIDDVVKLASSERARPAMKEIISKAREVSDAQAEIKKELLGWDDELLVNHLLEEGAEMLGLQVIKRQEVTPNTQHAAIRNSNTDLKKRQKEILGAAVVAMPAVPVHKPKAPPRGLLKEDVQKDIDKIDAEMAKIEARHPDQQDLTVPSPDYRNPDAQKWQNLRTKRRQLEQTQQAGGGETSRGSRAGTRRRPHRGGCPHLAERLRPPAGAGVAGRHEDSRERTGAGIALQGGSGGRADQGEVGARRPHPERAAGGDRLRQRCRHRPAHPSRDSAPPRQGDHQRQEERISLR